MRNSAFGGEEHACEFRPQLFPCIVQIPESIRLVECRPIQARRMTCPVRQFMKSSAVISSGLLESVLRREVNTVFRAIIKRAIRLIMRDLGSRVCQNLFACLDCFKLGVLGRLVCGDLVDLLAVENRINP